MPTQIILEPVNQVPVFTALQHLGTPEALSQLKKLQEMSEETTQIRDYRRVAQFLYANQELEIDDTAVVSIGEGGAWVSSWTWITEEEVQNVVAGNLAAMT